LENRKDITDIPEKSKTIHHHRPWAVPGRQIITLVYDGVLKPWALKYEILRQMNKVSFLPGQTPQTLRNQRR
jgi:hypothetical protein